MPELYPEDQKKVDEYLHTSVNSVERKPFRPWLLLGIIFCVLVALTLASWVIAHFHGTV